MIGLEYICNTSDKSYSDLAKNLDLSRQVVNSWIKGRRNIPEKHLKKLEIIFQIPKDYFQKEIDEIDKLNIQKIRLRNNLNDNTIEYDEIILDEDGNEINVTYTTYPEDLIEDIEMISYKIKRIEIHNNLDILLDKNFKNHEMQCESIWNMNDIISNISDIIELYDDDTKKNIINDIIWAINVAYDKKWGMKSLGNTNKNFVNSMIKLIKNYNTKS